MHYLKSAVVFVSCVLIFGVAIATAGDVNLPKDGKVQGKPFKELQNQINDLKAELDAIQVNGGIHVYDDNNQYLGFYAGLAPGAGLMSASIFNPTLKLFVIIESDPGDSNYGNVYRGHYNIDNMENIRLWQRDRLIRLCDDKYVAGVGIPLYTSIYGGFERDCKFSEWPPDRQEWRYDYREVQIDEIPFSLPVAMPLRYDYQAPSQ